jgi:glycosyltransferase involved in cell wall biosynthesis
MVHATSLLAPLHRHERVAGRNDQTVVTVHDAIAWTDPELLTNRQVSWNRAMTKRAQRFADAVVVPTHAVAEVLAEQFAFGDRIRVIGGAPSSRLRAEPDAAERRERLGLRGNYLLTVAGLDPRKGLEVLIAALGRVPNVTLVVVGAGENDADGITTWAHGRKVDPERVVVLDPLEDADLGAVLQGAIAFLQASRAEGFGLALVEALGLSLPVIHSDAPALVEVATDAGIVVPRDPDDEDAEADAYAAAIREVLDDGELRQRLSLASRDRSRAFSWRDSAEKVWQLHADL